MFKDIQFFRGDKVFWKTFLGSRSGIVTDAVVLGEPEVIMNPDNIMRVQEPSGRYRMMPSALITDVFRDGVFLAPE